MLKKKLCILPECPYCPSCKYGYIYQSFDWEEDRTEWNCTLTEEEYEKWEKENEANQRNT